MNKITHVIFDLDGLLLDTEVLYTEAIQNVASEYGKKYTWDLKVKCMGGSKESSAVKIIENLQFPISVLEFIEKQCKEIERIMPTAKLMPGAEKLVRHLHFHNIPMAIASGCAQESYDLKMTNHARFSTFFSHAVLASTDPEVKNGKPAPDVFLVCASRFADNPEPKKCLVFEDAPLGLQAGIAAGMQVVMVPDPRLDETLTKGATQVLASLEHFKPELYGLPPF